jgi:uncharacterized membrane protein YozB (DUF420 family)
VSVHDLPAVNATLNCLAAILLIVGYNFIRRRMIRAHATLMISSAFVSAIFLACYLVYHFSVPPRSAGLPPSALRTAYFVLLFSHVVLAIVVLPMIAATLYFASRRQFLRHRAIARPTFWIWLYVSVTGVLVYILLYHVFPSIHRTT